MLGESKGLSESVGEDKIAGSREVYDLAVKAKNYARQQIVKGASQLENNDLSYARQAALEKALIDDCKPLYLQKNLLQLDANPMVYDFEATIQVTSKYSLGNCGELAYQALDYFLSMIRNKKINAELYAIRGGDHVVLVVGRKPNSPASRPENWGDDACICDPWANKVYSAKEYLKELKNYTYQFKPYEKIPNNPLIAKSERVNLLENFDPRKHMLVPVMNYNNRYLSQMRSVETLRKNYDKKLDALVAVLQDYQIKLGQLSTRLSLHTEKDREFKIIKLKSAALSSIIRRFKIDMSFDKLKKSQGDYREVRSKLMHSLASYYDKTIKIMEFSPHEKADIAYIDQRRKISFFGIFSINAHRVQSAVKSALDSAELSISKRFNSL